MKKGRKSENFIKKPIYPGGPKALREVIRKNLRYPAEALANKISGTVHLRYTIDHRGAVVKSKIIAGLGHGCDEEAARLVGLLKFRVPKNRVGHIQFHKTLRVHFRLPEEVAPPVGNVHYTFVTGSDKKEDDDSSSSGGGYSYTITL